MCPLVTNTVAARLFYSHISSVHPAKFIALLYQPAQRSPFGRIRPRGARLSEVAITFYRL